MSEARPHSAARVTLLFFLGVAGVLLILEHRAHLLGAWPLLWLAACVGAHLFMHRGHARGGHGGH
ncbi:MAG: DUF2933 domain-containing protein [Gemmatimonadota bacterium]